MDREEDDREPSLLWAIEQVPHLQSDEGHSPLQRWEIEHVERTLGMQEKLLHFLMWAQGIALGVTLPAFLVALFLSGWKSKTEFELSDAVLMFLGGATITEIAGLITTAITTFLKPPRS